MSTEPASTEPAFRIHGTTEEIFGVAGLPFSPAIRVPAGGDLVFASGCVGPPTPDDPASDLRSEVRRVYRNLERTLAAAGASLADVVSVTKYLIDIERDNAVVAEETVAHLPHLPTSTTVEISRFVPPDMRLEVSAVAVVRPSSQ